MLSVIMLSVVTPSQVLRRCNNFIILIFVMLSAVKLSVVMLSVVMLKCRYADCNYAEFCNTKLGTEKVQ